MKISSPFSFFLATVCVVETSFNVSTAYRCGKALSGKYGWFHSPGFPLVYRDFLHCSWSITVEKGYYIMLRFTVFDVEYYPNCTYDYVKIIEEGRTLRTFCGNAAKQHDEAVTDKMILKSSGNRINFLFHSDYSNEEKFKGFEVHYRSADINECDVKNGGCDQLCHNYLGGYYCSCRIGYQLKRDNKSCDYALCKDVIFRSLQGRITSPEYPKNYPPHCNCTWKIYVPRGYRIVLEFKKFKIESHPDVKCPYDFLSVIAGRRHGPLCGRRLPKNITSSSNSMIIRFRTDSSTNFKGFLATYHSEGVKCPELKNPDNGVMNATGFSFKDEVFFSCHSGYNLKGASRIWCRSSGVWTRQPPVCKPVSCGPPGIPRKATLHGNKFTFNETVRFECDEFYEIYGEEELTCTEDGKWSDDLPECEPVCGNSSFANLYRQLCRGSIVGGNEAVRGSYPWHAHIKLDGVGVCGGSLLNEFWVITAAHCVVNRRRQVIRPFRFRVVLGLHNRSMENETQVKEMRVGQVFEHRAYNPLTFEADLALLRLTEPAIINDFVKPICLPDTDSSSTVIKPGARGVVAGWGRSTSSKLFPDMLQEVCLPVVATNTCRASFRDEGFSVTHDMFCAGPPTGGKDVCKGDSGGGYIFQDSGDSRWFLGGLVSWGSSQGCALPNKYGVYLKVEDYLDWIEKRIFR